MPPKNALDLNNVKPKNQPPVPEPVPAPEPVRIEAEAATVLENLQARALADASGGTVLQVTDKAAPARAAYAFDGQAGRFDISIDYFDENDGKAEMTLRVDGRDIGSWTWDAELGSALANASTLTSRTFAGVELTAGSVIELVGRADGDEPLRIDALRLQPTPAPVPEPAPVPVPEPVPAPEPVRIEAEAATVLENLQARALADASGGTVLQVTDKAAPARAAYAFDGQAGRFDISIDYFDENDGKAEMTLRVDGRDIGSWTWDAELGSALANASTLTSRTFAGVELTAGSVIELVGRADGDEPLRIDALRLQPTPAPVPEPAPVPVPEPVPAPEPVRIEAEAATVLENLQARALADASGGTVLQVTDKAAPARAAYAFDGQAGRFDISIDYFDENDGKAEMTLRVDGRDIGSWTWDAELGSALANASTLTSRTFAGVELTAGSVIELVGRADGDEPLRIDALRLQPTPAPVPEPAPVPVPEPVPAPEPVRIEAEAATVLENLQARALADASGGTVLQVTDKAAPARAAYAFDGQAGRFDISIDYFDENDGKAEMTLRVDGRDIGSWTWDAELGSALANASTLTSRTFAGVELTAGSVIELVGRADGDEPLRIDALRLQPAGGAETPPDQPDGGPDIHRGPPTVSAPAFAGAIGFGSDTGGGRGGDVVHVTNLNDSGSGSLRWALEDVTGPRIVVFDVEGQITLNREIVIDDPFVTIAGQTAPGEGVVVSGARISIETHDVIMRGMKLRAGDGAGDTPKNRDNLAIGGNGDKGVENVVVDHNSFTWSVDESVSIWGTVRDVTVSNNIIAEALHDSIHIDEGMTEPAPHGMGMIIGHAPGDADSEFITVARNLFASNVYRNAFIKGADMVEFANNYVVNYGAAHQGLKLGGDTAISVAVVGNVYEDGVDTGGDPRPAFDLRSLASGSLVWLDDNFVEGHRELDSQAETDAAHGKLDMVTRSAFFAGSGMQVLSSDAVAAYVLANAGARLASGGLDAVDARIVKEAGDGTTEIIDSPNEVGGFGVYQFTGARVVDTDRDGMPDWFEMAFAAHGFDAGTADDKLDYDNDGFTNVEEYVNGLIDGFDFLV